MSNRYVQYIRRSWSSMFSSSLYFYFVATSDSTVSGSQFKENSWTCRISGWQQGHNFFLLFFNVGHFVLRFVIVSQSNNLMRFAGCWGTHGFAPRKGFTQMDEFPAEKSRIREGGFKFLIWSEGKRMFSSFFMMKNSWLESSGTVVSKSWRYWWLEPRTHECS